MNWTRLSLAAAGGVVVMCGLHFVWHAPLFGNFYLEQNAAIRAPEIAVPGIFLAEAIRALVLAFIYPFGYKGGAPAMEGVRFGILMGLFSAMPLLIYVSRYNYSSFTWFWVEGLFFVIQGAIAGIVIAYIHGTGAGKAS